MLDWIEDSAGWLAGVLAGLAALGVMSRWAVKRARTFSRKWDSAREALVGREEILHPDSGIVLVQATPGLGQRLAKIEDNLVTLSDTRSEMAAIVARVDSLAASFDAHTTASAEVWQTRSEEAKAMWEAIKAVAEAEPAATRDTNS